MNLLIEILMTKLKSVFLIGLVFVLTCTTSNGQGRVLSKKQLLEDISQLESVLLMDHPAVSSTEQIQAIKDQVAYLKNEVKEESSMKESFAHVSSIVEKIECSHTSIYPGSLKSILPKQVFPVKLALVEDKILVAEDIIDGERTIEKGLEIITINGDSIGSVMKNLLLFHGGSDEQNARIEKEHALFMFGDRYWLVYGPKDEFSLELYDRESKSMILAEVESEFSVQGWDKINLDIDEEKNIGVLTLRSFHGYDPFQLVYALELREVFKKINANELSHLIIDVRDNLGGAIINTKRVLKYLLPNEFQIYDQVKCKSSLSKKSSNIYIFMASLRNRKNADAIQFKRFTKSVKPAKKNNYKGKLTVLMNAKSLSASCIFGAKIKSEGRGKLIGDESGGAYGGTYGGYFRLIELRHSKIHIRIPLLRFDLNIDESKQDFKTNLEPDIFIPLKYSSLINDKDLGIEKSYELFGIE